MPPPTPEYLRASARHELANSLTHGFGSVLSLAGLVALVRQGQPRPDWAHLANVVFGLSLCVLYAASTCYHGLTDWRHRPHPLRS